MGALVFSCPFLTFTYSAAPFLWAEGGGLCPMSIYHEYILGVAQSILNLISVMHDFAERIHEIAQHVYDSYIRRTRSVHGWDDFGLDE